MERWLNKIVCGDALATLRELPNECVQMFMTSVPYWGLRDYGFKGQQGLEATPQEYIAKMVEVFREGRRVLKKDGTLWLNIGDSYATWEKKFKSHFGKATPGSALAMNGMTQPNRMPIPGLKAKDLVGIPWSLAFALRADGWYLRRDIIWHKPNCMPESVKDRPTTAHEYLFLLSKSTDYFYDGDAIKEPCAADTVARYLRGRSDNHKWAVHPSNWHNSPNYQGQFPASPKLPGAYKGSLPGRDGGPGQDRRSSNDRHVPNKEKGREGQGLKTAADFGHTERNTVVLRNKRSVWSIPSCGFSEAHFATFPPDLVKPCVLAGSRPGDIVIDPYGGSGTVAVVARNLGRNWILIEGKPEYCEMAEKRYRHETAQLNLFNSP